MAYGTRAAFEAVKELGFGSISGTYAAVGTAVTDHSRILRFVNATDVEVYISTDASTDMVRMAANSFVLYDLSSNKVTNDGLFLPVGSIFYTKQVSGAPTSGTVWIEVIYAQGGV